MECTILKYLAKNNVQYKYEGSRYKCSSPFSNDSNWSMMIYPETDSFYDFSNGFGGALPQLIQRFEQVPYEDALEIAHGLGWERKVVTRPKEVYYTYFDYTTFITKSKKRIKEVYEYAKSRRIHHHFNAAAIEVFKDNKKQLVSAMMFVHYDNQLRPVGAKFRLVNNTLSDQRFTSRGKCYWYVLENLIYDSFQDPILYIVESETSANSLWNYLYEKGINAVVLSGGSVGATPSLPLKYRAIKDRRVLIDFDGNEELFTQRIKQYKRYNAFPIKLQLPKGEDINSLYAKGNTNIFKHLILKRNL